MARELRNILVNRISDRAMEELAPRTRGRLVDIGCGSAPYRPLFSRYVSEYVGVDRSDGLHGSENVDIQADAYSIPVPSGSFDSVLCTAVLEHLEDPLAALQEARRITSDGGFAIYTMPFIWHLHEQPRDFFRYTPYGIRYLFEKAGWQIEEIRPLSGFWVTFGQLSVYYFERFTFGRLRVLRPLVMALGVVIQAAAAALDRLDRAEEWSFAYLVTARAA